MDRLEVINAMLQAVGEDIVTSASSNNPDVQTVSRALDTYIKKLLTMERWWFNTNYSLTLAPDNSGQIVIPSNTLRLIVQSPYSYLVQRGTRLFDPINTTYNIGFAVKCEIQINMAIEDIPESVAQYIQAWAIHRFYVDDDGDADKANVYFNERNLAMVTAKNEQLRQMNLNANMSPRAASLLYRIRPSYLRGAYNQNLMLPGGRRLSQ